MTDKEKAIVMAHTGICMLTGEKYGVFHKYIEDILGRPVYTHELAIQSISDEIKEKSRDDFIKLCMEEQQPCGDAISREDVEECKELMTDVNGDTVYAVRMSDIRRLSHVKPQYTEDEIQKIQDLEQTEIEKAYELGKVEGKESENAISRQAVNTLIDELARAISDERCCISRGRSTATIMRDILHLPPVTPQQKIGQWIAYEVRLPDRTILNYQCSVCGRKLIGYNTETLSEAPFCHCGAKMQEEKDDT